jgi:hypothetical protein
MPVGSDSLLGDHSRRIGCVGVERREHRHVPTTSRQDDGRSTVLDSIHQLREAPARCNRGHTLHQNHLDPMVHITRGTVLLGPSLGFERALVEATPDLLRQCADAPVIPSGEGLPDPPPDAPVQHRELGVDGDGDPPAPARASPYFTRGRYGPRDSRATAPMASATSSG